MPSAFVAKSEGIERLKGIRLEEDDHPQSIVEAFLDPSPNCRSAFHNEVRLPLSPAVSTFVSIAAEAASMEPAFARKWYQTSSLANLYLLPGTFHTFHIRGHNIFSYHFPR